jgi:RNA polymerase sigma factor (sigma-70 family)
MTLDADVTAAQGGDRDALERVVRAIQDDVFHLALRMIGDADAARDAAQEALVRIVTKLGSFRGESKFTTWAFRVATNALLDARESRYRREQSFDQLGTALDAAVATAGPATGETSRLLDEAKYVCTQGMLLCLDRAHRLAFILGEILELSGDEAAAILEISHAAFRKRLSRARDDMQAFLGKRCGFADPANACRCEKLLPVAVAQGLIDPDRLTLGALPTRKRDELHASVEQLRTAVEIFRSLPSYAVDADLAQKICAML